MNNFSKLKCVRSDATLTEAKKIMTDFRIRHLPVIDDKSEIIGIISLHDFLDTEAVKDFPVSYFVSTPVHYVYDTDEIKKAALMMVEKKISCVLVIDSSESVIGLITSTDLIYHLAQILEAQAEPLKIKDVYNEKQSEKETTFRIVETVGQLAQSLSNVGI